MKTQVIMQRPLLGSFVRQKSKNELLNVNDLLIIGNKIRLNSGKSIFKVQEFLRTKSVAEFKSELIKTYGKEKVYSAGRNGTWVHPFLFIDIALAINPTLKISVYKWLYDYLLQSRISSGDTYKKMVGALYSNLRNKSCVQNILQKKIAPAIRRACGVGDSKDAWQKANERQLNLRIKIQENISLLADYVRDVDLLIQSSIDKAILSLK